MNRIVQLALTLLAVEMTAVAVGGVVWGWRAGLIADGDLRQRLTAAFLLVFPAFAWAVLAWAPRRLASERPRLSDDHRRHLQAALLFQMIVLAAAQAWIVNVYAGLAPPPLDRETFARLAFVLMGVAMAVRGNFVAKVSPPSGEGAPDPGAWTRLQLRTGWVMTILGAATVACALALPVRTLVPVALVVGAALAGLSLMQRGMARKAESPQ